MPPTSRAGANQTLPFGTTTAGLDGTASTASAGSIVAWLWTLLWPTDGSVILTNPTTATPTLTFTGPGPARVALNVQQTDLTWAFTPITTDPDVVYTLPVAMPTAYTEVTVQTQYAGLSIPAPGERQDARVGSPNPLQQKWVDLFNTVDALAGIEPAGSQQATRWVTAEAGPADADGSASNPFNATSAATNSFDGPWNQAKASLIADSTPATLGYTIIAYPGAYDEDLNITADRQWNINWLGNCTFNALNDFIFIGTTGTNLVTSPLADGSSMTFGRVGLGNPVAHSWYWFARASAWASVNVSGTLLAGVQASFEQCFCTANFNLPNLTVNYATGCTFGTGASDFTAGLVTVATGCTFSDDLTLSTASSTGGFYDCTFAGTPLFTGPAGSARFDPITARRFIAASGTFAGGAGKADFLPITTSAIVIDNGAGTGSLTTNAITTPVSTGLTVSAGSTMSVSATTTLDLGAGGVASLTAGAGADVTVTGGSNHGVVLAGGAGSTYDAKVDRIREKTGSGGVDVQFAKVTGTSTATSQIAVSGIVADDSASVFVGLNGGGDEVTIQATGLVLTASYVSATSAEIFSATNQTAFFPLAVTPNGTFNTLKCVPSYDGTFVSADFVSAVAAASAAGDIVVSVRNGSDSAALSDTPSIDGATTASLTVNTSTFTGGFFVRVVSNNPDALQGAGLTLRVIYTITNA